MKFDWPSIANKLFGRLKGSTEAHIQLFDKDSNEITATDDVSDAVRFFVTVKNADPDMDDLESYSYLATIVDDGVKSHIDIKTPSADHIGDRNFDDILGMVEGIKTSIGLPEAIKINWSKFNKDIEPKFSLLKEQQELDNFFNEFDINQIFNKLVENENAQLNAYIKGKYIEYGRDIDALMDFLLSQPGLGWRQKYENDPSRALSDLESIVW